VGKWKWYGYLDRFDDRYAEEQQMRIVSSVIGEELVKYYSSGKQENINDVVERIVSRVRDLPIGVVEVYDVFVDNDKFGFSFNVGNYERMNVIVELFDDRAEYRIELDSDIKSGYQLFRVDYCSYC